MSLKKGNNFFSFQKYIPFKQVNLIVNDEGDTNSHTTGSIGEMQVEEADNDDSDMREIEAD